MPHSHTRSTALRGAVLLCAALTLPAAAAAQARMVAPFPLGVVAPDGAAPLAAPEPLALLPVPVQGVAREDLRDSYREGRGRGRTHHAIDIHAPRGTPVLAVAAGRIIKLHSGDRGGLSVYLLDDDGRTRYYYAHLDGYAQGLAEGQRVERGEVIGFVGDTGNAAPGDYHLHFSVAILEHPGRWWEGRNVNPFLLLRGASGR
jgi:peptidoglycan LD-endopeptidase LytH